MLPGTCNCDPFARTKGSFCGNLHEQSSFFDGFSASHSCSFHTSGYLVPNRRPFPYLFDNRVGYLCGIDCTSSWRRLDEWNEGQRLYSLKWRSSFVRQGPRAVHLWSRGERNVGKRGPLTYAHWTRANLILALGWLLLCFLFRDVLLYFLYSSSPGTILE